jgi:hypothetical protein
MFSIARRATVLLLLLVFLCSALPAAAAPARRAHAAKTPVLLGPDLFDQVVSWLVSLWPSQESRLQSSWEKSGFVVDTGTTTNSSSTPTDTDRGAMIDPNGGN